MYEAEILEVYQHCNIKSFPVDCDLILQRFGYEVITYKQKADGNKEELQRLKQISRDGFIVRKEEKMYLNDELYSKRILFTKAHEIGHLVMVSDNEDVADTFASNLLAPRPIIYAENLRTTDSISSYFGISISAANIALMNMNQFRKSINPFPTQASLELMEYFGYRKQFPSLFVNYVSNHEYKPSRFILELLQKDEKEKEREKKKKIRSLKGKIQRLQRKLVETKDETEWYKAKDRLAKEQMRLDMLLGISLEDY